MPVYRFSCGSCGDFEKRAGYEDSTLSCSCGGVATRAPYSGSVGVHVEGRVLPTNPVEMQQHTLKKTRESGWDYDRSMSLIRKNTARDKEGHLKVNTAGVMSAS